MIRSIILVIFVAISAVALAQGGPGSIGGRVSDSQQLALSRAVIELEDSGGLISSKKLLLTKLAITRSSQFPLPPTLSASLPLDLSLAKKVLSR